MVVNLHAKLRKYEFSVSNPKAQWFYVTGEMYSERHYPRAAKCDPKNSVVLYFEDSAGTAVEPDRMSYGYMGWKGFATMGKFAAKLPAGEYTISVVNQNYKEAAKDVALNFYATEEMPTIAAK